LKKYADAVFQLVQEARDHPTMERLYARLKPEFPGISLATVYNNVNALAEKGLVRRIPSAGGPDRYDKAFRHDHLVCTRCGVISDIDLQDMTNQFRHQVGEGFLTYHVQVDYVCPDCRRKAHGAEQQEEKTC